MSVVDMGEYKDAGRIKRGHIDYTDKLAAVNGFERVSRLDKRDVGLLCAGRYGAPAAGLCRASVSRPSFIFSATGA